MLAIIRKTETSIIGDEITSRRDSRFDRVDGFLDMGIVNATKTFSASLLELAIGPQTYVNPFRYR